MNRVEFAVAYPPELLHPLHRRLVEGDAASRAELLTWGPTEAVTALLWVDADRTATADLLGAVGSTASTDLVGGDGGTYAFVRQTEYEFAEPVMALVSDARAAFLPPVTFAAGGEVRFEAVGEPAGLSELHARLSDLGEASIERVHEFERRRSPAALTARQREALEAAERVGYYEVPRTGTVADVADELDCAPSTAGELLRKAESAVVDDYTRS